MVSRITDGRKRPRLATRLVMAGALVMMLARLGSLNALEKTKRFCFWKKWIGPYLPSADSMARIVAVADPETLRIGLHQIYTCLKRNKAIIPPWQGLIPLILDGHESHATYRRHCQGCLTRTIHADRGDQVQYYHRHVTAFLAGKDLCLLLDAEPQIPGEDEVACAIRLLERIIKRYPRAFDVVLGDALYTDPRFYHFLVGHGKDVLTVLKDERRDLITDARALFASMDPHRFSLHKTQYECCDLEGFASWPQFERGPIRVIASRETTSVCRQLTKQDEQKTSDWLWVTTLSKQRADSQTAVQMGHARWLIENRGFNETSNAWHADHVYKHEPTALLNFLLVTMMAYNLFHAFFHRNLKQVFRKTLDYLHLARMVSGELFEKSSAPIVDSS